MPSEGLNFCIFFHTISDWALQFRWTKQTESLPFSYMLWRCREYWVHTIHSRLLQSMGRSWLHHWVASAVKQSWQGENGRDHHHEITKQILKSPWLCKWHDSMVLVFIISVQRKACPIAQAKTKIFYSNSGTINL